MGRRPLLILCLLVAVSLGAGVATADPVSATASPSSGDSPPTANDSFPVTLTDATGTAVTVDSRPERITTTNPSAAQTMWTLGAADQVVGVTQYASYLDGAEQRDNVSAAGLGVSIERVVATEPDLVLAPNATSRETVATLRDANLTVYHFPAATDFEAVAAKTQTTGRLTGNTAAAAETNAWMWQNVAATESQTADAARQRVLYPLLGGFAVGNNTFIDEIITTAGGENVAASEFDGYRQLNDETVIALDPEVLIVTDQTEGQILGSTPYSQTAAGQNNRTATLSVQYLNQPAPRSVVYSTSNLSAQLHPDSAADVSTTTEDGDPATGVSAPGFGIGVAVAALVAIVASARLRERP
ncbi:corrinoid ABC transporter substrate-binding protein [Halonotius roseus]|uniref:Corrinoid ABC transporter substrate-binding protein n=1 Tax=Halonotius roseus TaxID=2511997 RepID=A0A544QME5_9EURY|nr:corrinoid ABC transporter substrate-binding protein [Halonotius roseus]